MQLPLDGFSPLVDFLLKGGASERGVPRGENQGGGNSMSRHRPPRSPNCRRRHSSSGPGAESGFLAGSVSRRGLSGGGVCADGRFGLPAALESNALKCWFVRTLTAGVL